MGLMLVLLGTSCQNQDKPIDVAQRQNRLLLGNSSECSRLDPQLAFHASERRVQMALFEPLVTLSEDGRVLPALAQTWVIDADYRRYRFYMKEGLKWSDGHPLGAEDAVFALQRVLMPRLGAEASFLVDLVEAVTWIDPLTFEVYLSRSSPYFLKLMAYLSFAPMPKHCILQYGEADSRLNNWDKPEHIVCSGPFYLKEWVLGQYLLAEKNPFYWDASHVALNQIQFYPIVDSDTEEKAFRQGQLHVTYGLPTYRFPHYQLHEPNLLVVDYQHAATELYLVNTQRPGLDDVRIRRALNLAIDRQALVQLFPDKRLAAAGFVPPWVPDYQTPPGLLDFNPIQARQLLAEAGGAQRLPVIELLYSSSAPYKPVAEALQAQWKTHLGIDVHIVQTDAKNSFYKIFGKNFDLGRIVWRVDCDDAGAILTFFESHSRTNPTSWRNDAFDRALQESFSAQTPEKRYAALQKAETLLIEASPLIPLYYQPIIHLKQPSVQGWEIVGASYIPYKKIRFNH